MNKFGIKVLAMDVDGTLTDGKIYIGASGESFKVFDIKDGYAIKHFLPDMGITPIIVTGRESAFVSVRAKELGIQHIYQGITAKDEVMYEICQQHHVNLTQIAFIGDDLNDLPAMEIVGLAACPSNAALEVKNISTYICQSSGGSGAVREFCEWLRCES